MKPNYQVESVKWLSRYDDPKRRGGSFPPIAFDYQPRREGSILGGGLAARRPGFSRLAREVLRPGFTHTLDSETVVLGFVTLVSAWPIAMMIREVIGLLK
jgi:hypothetical protein